MGDHNFAKKDVGPGNKYNPQICPLNIWEMINFKLTLAKSSSLALTLKGLLDVLSRSTMFSGPELL